MSIAAQVFDIAHRLPDLPAVTGEGGTFPYRELAARAGAIAGTLRERHRLAPGERVLMAMENCAEFFEVLLGCWTAGLCAVPVNAKLHPKEVAYIAETSGARLCVTTPGLHDALAPLARDIDCLDAVVSTGTRDYAALAQGQPITPVAADPTAGAWLFFTSGTTGRPKGAMLSHRALLFMSHCYYADIDFVDERDTLLHAAPLSHGSGLYALPHLLKGGHQLVLSGSFDADHVLGAVARHPNVSFFAAPTMVSRLVRRGAESDADTRNLKTIIYGGAPMYVAELERALEALGPRLYQLYGQGESPMTITGLAKRLHADTDHPRYRARLASCGYPRTGVAVKVVDPEGRDLPPGEIGEVATRSDCLMTEYLGDAAATAAALKDGWLMTGDLGSMDADGLLTLRDRSKDLIISGGANIYPREIEEVLLRHPEVVEVSVIGRPHAEWGEEVVAFVVVRPGARVETTVLDRLCLDNVARFKRPRANRFVEALPKNNYGKVLKTELRRRAADGPR
jgi:acyl-CoA synthetase (AMP-forming)/AMP-acid ligase II